ncbi:MAG: hypothetical protein WAM11_00570 [Cyanobium sp.]
MTPESVCSSPGAAAVVVVVAAVVAAVAAAAVAAALVLVAAPVSATPVLDSIVVRLALRVVGVTMPVAPGPAVVVLRWIVAMVSQPAPD